MRWLGRLGLVCLGLLVAVGILEAVLRVFFGPADIDRYVSPAEPVDVAHWVDHPFLPFVGRPNAEYELQVGVNGTPVTVRVRNNSYGFRAHELPTVKGPRDYFVVVLGESTTWGAAAENNASAWPELLEAKLRVRYPERNVRVFNLGTQNVTVAYNVVVLALIGVHVQPDLVIAYHGFNDFGPATTSDYRFDHAHFFRNLALEHRWHGFQKSLVPRPWLRSYAVAYLTHHADRAIGANALSFYVQHPVDFVMWRDDEGVKAAVARNWRHLKTMAAMARGNGAAVLFSTFQFFDGTNRYNRLTNQTLRDFFAAEAIDYVDLDALIPDHDRALQYDECHFTRAGEELVAANFFEQIVRDAYVESRPLRR